MAIYAPDNYFLLANSIPKDLDKMSKPATMYVYDKAKQKIIVQHGYLCIESWTFIYNALYASKRDKKIVNDIIPTCAGRAGNELEVIRNHVWIYNDNPEYDTPEKKYAAVIDAFLEREHEVHEDYKRKIIRSEECLEFLYKEATKGG